VGDDGTNSNQSEPAMGIGEYGHPYLVWTDGRSANTEVYYAGSTFVDPVAMKAKDVSASLGATIGTDPAIISSVDDVSVVVPLGACLCDTKIAISKIKNPETFAMQCLGSYDFGPSGMEFSRPVTITIPYVVPVSGTPASVYWYNSLTGALSQGGITDLVNLQISSSLNALRFSSVHFTPFYLLFRNCVALPITKCSVKNGRIPGAGQDSIQISGVIGVASNDLVNADDMNIAIKSVADNHLVFSESIKFNPNSVRRGRYVYNRRLKKNEPGGITSFQLDVNKHTFALQIQNVDLTGLSWPMSVEIEIGDYVGVGQVESRPKK
jgi:hypothetical protein